MGVRPSPEAMKLKFLVGRTSISKQKARQVTRQEQGVSSPRADVTKGIRGYVTVNLCECPRMSAYRRIPNPRICEYLCEL